MLLRLHIKNAALIEKADIEFGYGLNILTGETGAGKSMIIDSVNFVLGERASKDFVRTGAKNAQVVAEFEISNDEIQRQFEQMGIEIEDNAVIIQRTLSSEGKSSNRINGTPVTVSMLKRLSESLIDVHGQHEHQSLLNPAKHIDILDSFCMPEIDDIKRNMGDIIKEYKTVIGEIKSLSGEEYDIRDKIEKLEFRINEINDAALKENEENILNERRDYLNNIDKVMRNTRESLKLLYEGEDEILSASDQIGHALNLMNELKEFDSDALKIYNALNEVSDSLEDTVRDIRRYNSEIDGDPDEIEEIEERLDLIYNLKKKYGPTVHDILEFRDKAQQELDFIINSGETLEKLIAKKKELLAQIKNGCDIMTDIRRRRAEELSIEIEKQLKDLEMRNAEFKINVKKKETFSFKGNDTVEFLISPNLGEELKPLSKIASGGEMSRIMLALKTVVADAETIDTFIFDEIDTGVSGKTASRVGEKMAAIAKKRQILCITHLPQIAAMADNHFLMEKSVEGNKTITNIICLDNYGSVNEISRLMGGDNGGIVEKAAAKMKEDAQSFKKSLK